MRTYRPDWTEYGISRQRYNELRAYCMQYPEWKSEASSLASIGAQNYGERVQSSDNTSTVARAVERREHLMAKILTVEQTAMAIDQGKWYAALIQNVCMGKPLSCIDVLVLPTSNRNAYYAARRRFYIALHLRLDTRGAAYP